VFALAGIGALFAFVIAAWKFGGNGKEQIPNLATTKASTTSTLLKPATPRHVTPAKPATFKLYMRAVHGNCWMDVRNWSSSGKSRFTGTVELQQAQRFVARRLYISFGNPGNLAIVFNGKLVTTITRGGSYLFTPRGFSRAA
jgi:hypothetical protein